MSPARWGFHNIGSRPSAIRVASATFLGPIAASRIGIRAGLNAERSALPSPVDPGPVYGNWWIAPSCSTRPSAAKILRTMATYSSVVVNGLLNGCPCQPSTTWGPDMPRPRRNLAPLSRSSVSAVIAVEAGDRAGICMIADPIFTVVVDAAAQVSGVTASVPYASPAHTVSNPSCSASRAWSRVAAPERTLRLTPRAIRRVDMRLP